MHVDDQGVAVGFRAAFLVFAFAFVGLLYSLLLIGCDCTPIGTFKCKDHGSIIEGEFCGFRGSGSCDEDEYSYCLKTRGMGAAVNISKHGRCEFRLNKKDDGEEILDEVLEKVNKIPGIKVSRDETPKEQPKAKQPEAPKTKSAENDFVLDRDGFGF
jgi:hypothetical protein